MTIQERMFQLETDLILNTLSHINKGNFASADWGVNRLRDLGVLNRSNNALITKSLEDITPAIRQELLQAQKEIDQSIKTLIPKDSWEKALPLNASPRMKQIISTWEFKAVNDISKTGSVMLSYLGNKYEEAVQQVIAKGFISGESARTTIKNTVVQLGKELGSRGVEALKDKAGRTWSLEGYSQMVVRSNIRQTVNQTQFDRFQEYGQDLIEVSSHVGARPNCAPYQGYVYSLSGNNPNYPAFSTTSYGEIDGLLGINCGHRLLPYIEGTKKSNQPVPLKENSKAYEESQVQRKLERDIRKEKRNIQIAKQDGDKEGLRISQEKLKANREEMKKFIERTGRTERLDRQRIY